MMAEFSIQVPNSAIIGFFVVVITLVIATPAGYALARLDLPGANQMGMAIFAAGVLTTTSYPALYDMVSPGMRGRSLALYLFLGNICGLGGGTLAVAFITENVFGDERLLRFSVALAALGAMTISVLMTLIMKGQYEAARLAHHNANAQSAIAQA